MNEDEVPCKVCGEPTKMTGTKLCDPCWEVERNLDHYVRTAEGRRRAQETIASAVESERAK